eukprot:7163148-Alexandrium_andersonii.AAC.1
MPGARPCQIEEGSWAPCPPVMSARALGGGRRRADDAKMTGCEGGRELPIAFWSGPVSYTHLRAHETSAHL